MPNTREKMIESLERSLNHDGTGREMRFVGMDKPIIPINPYRWIPVTERLPEDEVQVLACTKHGKPFPAHCKYGKWRVSGSVTITHWMPLPEPPKGE